MKIQTINPATGEPGAEYPEHSLDEIRQRTRAAHERFREWRVQSMDDRAAPMRRAAAILRENADGYARLIATEMGKPVSAGRAEVEKCAWVCDYYAEKAAEFLAPQRVETDASTSLVHWRPLGVLLAVMPWNYPFWQVFRAAVPNLMAGNAVMLKHAPNVPGCATAIEAIFRHAGFPDDLFGFVLVSREQEDEATEAMLDMAEVRGVTLTGSVTAGATVAAKAGARVKKSVLELGGSDAYLVLDDADLDVAVDACVTSRLLNTGQSCIGAKRLIVTPAVRQEFESRLIEAMGAHQPDDPLLEETKLGPLARTDLRDTLHGQVEESVEKGAQLALGGTVPERPGAWYPPTVLTNVGADMPAYREELFGPVAAVIPADDAEDALRIANDSRYGLGAAVFSRNIERATRIAGELEAGNTFINTYVRSDPRLPFGGVKQSGYGRELGAAGIREFVNACTVYVA